jgi:hypothetical protein
MDIVAAQSNVAQHPVIHLGEARRTVVGIGRTGEVSRH